MSMPPLRFVWIACLALAFWIPAQIPAQSKDLAEAYDEAVAHMESGEYDKGLELISTVIEENAAVAPKRYGPAFGHFYYLKGMLLIRQKNYGLAIEPLRICYEKYGNEDMAQGMVPNVFQIHALMQWGGCLQALSKFEEAAEKYEKVVKEDTKREPRINQLSVQMNLARCYIRMGERERGEKILRGVMNLQGLSAEALQDVFTMMAADDVGGGTTGPGAMDMVLRHNNSLFGTVDNRAVMNPRLAALGTQALEKGRPLDALLWYNLMTSPYESILAKTERKADLLARKKVERGNLEAAKKIDEVVASIDKEIVELHQLHGDALLGMGSAHLGLGTITAARALYEELYKYFPDHSQRAVVLHNLVICEARLNRWDQAFLYGDRFFKDYADHELRPKVAQILAEVVYLRSDFELAYEMAVEARTELSGGNVEREGLDFVAGASLFQLGRLENAEPELEAFISQYPKSERLETMRFYLCATKVSLAKWGDASPLLTAFVQDYPQSTMRATALYMGASAELVMEEYDKALAMANTLIKLYPDAREIARAHNLRGDILSSMEADLGETIQAYEDARAATDGKSGQDAEVGAYSLKQLIRSASAAGEWEKALGYYEAFQNDHEGSAFEVEAAVAALDVYVALDRKDEARSLLEEMVLEKATDPEADLDLIFGSYSDFLLSEYSPGDAFDSLEKFGKTGAANSPEVKAAILMGQIEVLEASGSKDKKRINQLYGKIADMWQDGERGFSGLVKVRLARWLSDQGRKKEADRIYEEVLKTDRGGDALGYALVDSAKLDYKTANPSELRQAKSQFEQVLTQVDDARLVEEAVLGLGRIAIQEGDYKTAEDYWLKYLDQPTWNLARPEANYSYALSLDKQKKTREALKVYVSVYSNFSGHLDWSTEANIRAAEILRDIGEDLKALQLLQDMLRRTKDLEHPNLDRAKTIFFKWRDEYSASNP